MDRNCKARDRVSLYALVTQKVISELEMGRLPWVQPWVSGGVPCDLPRNAASGRAYSGINVLILWNAVTENGWRAQRWLTYRQALRLGGHVRRGEQGTAICYADRFVPTAERARADERGGEARAIAFLKRFTVFNVDQCEGLPSEVVASRLRPGDSSIHAEADKLIAGSGADFLVGGDSAFYALEADYVQVPEQSAFPHPLDWYRTAFHELGHWTGHPSQLARDQRGTLGGPDYAREELVAEMASAFVCAALGIEPRARHSDYIGAWLLVLRGDDRAIFRAASQASKAADLLLRPMEEGA